MALASGLLFFFQAEDGIRDLYVTGVQTCALPISVGLDADRREPPIRLEEVTDIRIGEGDVIGARRHRGLLLESRDAGDCDPVMLRSEERRVGKEYGSGGRSGRDTEKDDMVSRQRE